MDILAEYNKLESILEWAILLNTAFLLVGLAVLLSGEIVGLGFFVAGAVGLVLAWLTWGYADGLYLTARNFRDSVIAKGGEG